MLRITTAKNKLLRPHVHLGVSGRREISQECREML